MSQGTMWSELDLCTMRIVVDNYMAALSEDKPFGKYTQIKVRPWFGGRSPNSRSDPRGL